MTMAQMAGAASDGTRPAPGSGDKLDRLKALLREMFQLDRGRNCLILWRDLDETKYLALDAWFERNRAEFADPLDVISVNSDLTLNAMRQPGETWVAKPPSQLFTGGCSKEPLTMFSDGAACNTYPANDMEHSRRCRSAAA